MKDIRQRIEKRRRLSIETRIKAKRPFLLDFFVFKVLEASLKPRFFTSNKQ